MYFVKIIIVCNFDTLKKCYDLKCLNSAYYCKVYGIINYDKAEKESKLNSSI